MNPTASGFDQDTLARIQRARASGYDENTVMQRATQYQASKQPTAAPKKTNFADFLPLIGGVAGSFIPGLGTIAGGAAGAGLGTLLKQGIKQEPISLGEVGKEAALAGAGGVVGKGIGWGLSKLAPTLAKGLTAGGETLAAKAFRVNPGQATKFAKETGEEFPKFLASRALTSPEQVLPRIEQLQGQFDNVVLSKNLTVDPFDIVGGFNREIKRLTKSILPADKAKANVLETIKSNFVNEFGGGPVPADQLTALRKQIDQGIKEFSLNQEVKGPLNLTRDVFQNALRDTADTAGVSIDGQSLKATGVELSKLYKALEIANRQGRLGMGSMPIGITKLLGGAVGGATGGVEGAGVGMAAAGLANDPKILSIMSRLSTGAGKAVQGIPSMAESRVPGLTRTGVGAGSILGMGGGDVQAAGNISMDQPDMSGGGIDNTQEETLRQVLGSIMFSKAKNVSDIKAAYEFMNPTTAQKPLTDMQQRTRANAASGLQALNMVEGILGSDPNAPLKSKIPIVSGQSPYLAASREIADVLTRLRTGAALNEQEQAIYMGQLPQPFDSEETIAYKLNLFRELFQRLSNQ